MLGFLQTLMGIGLICDAGFTVMFSEDKVVVHDATKCVILSGWRDPEVPPALLHFNLLLSPQDVPVPAATCQQASIGAYSVYDLPSVPALVRYLHARVGFPARDTWLRAIKVGNYATWPGLTYNNAAKYCPNTDETIMGHMVQTRQGVRSTKPKKPKKPTNAKASSSVLVKPPEEPSRELHIHVRLISRLYTDDTGCFPVCSRSGNQYIMVAYHCDANVILACPFKTRKDPHCLKAYAAIMESLKQRGHDFNLQLFDYEIRAAYKKEITETWGAKFQLVPPNMHRRNAGERAICTFKAHFLAVLAGVAPDFPRFLWDLLVPQAVIQLNFLRQATLSPRISAWEYFNGPFDYDATPFGPLSQKVIAYNKPGTRNSWEFRGEDEWSIGTAMDGYRSQRYDAEDTKCEQITDTISFRHQYLTVPDVTPEDHLQHRLIQLTSALQEAPNTSHNAQLEAIKRLLDAFHRWAPPPTAPTAPPPSSTHVPTLRRMHNQRRPAPAPTAPSTPTPTPRLAPWPARTPPAPVPRMAPVPRVPSAPGAARPVPADSQPVAHRTWLRPDGKQPPRVADTEPIATRTRSRTKRVGFRATFVSAFAFLTATTVATVTRHATRPRCRVAPPPPMPWEPPPQPPLLPVPAVSLARAASRQYPKALLLHLACPVTDKETGKALEYRHLKRHPKLASTWQYSYSNKMGRLYQGVGWGTKGPNGQPVAGTDTFRVICYNDIPCDQRKEIAHVKVVCEVRPQKTDPNRTRITVAGNHICYPGNVGTPTASLDLVKLMLNSVLSRPGARLACFDAANFYLQTPEMDRKEYV